MLMTLDILSIFKFYFDCNEALFYKSKINSYVVYVVKKGKSKKDSVHL